MLANATRRLIKQRLSDETGRIDKDASRRIALAYPSPYTVAMSSLGYQQIYRSIQAIPGMACERVFLADAGAPAEIPLSYEGLRPLGDFPVVALSVAYELEIAGVIRLLQAGNIPALREQRGPS